MATLLTKSALARNSGIARCMLYYEHKQFVKDWALKIEIENTLHIYPSYGHKRLALELKKNKKRVLRVMKLFGIKPYRRRGRKYQKSKEKGCVFPNLLLSMVPNHPHHIWASDFTHIPFHGKTAYLATVMDIFTREVVGWSIMMSHGVHLIISALTSAVTHHPKPEIIHSDQGSEYTSQNYVSLASNLDIRISMSRKASPWENGYQESFYNQFKVDLGDPNRFTNLGELIAAIHETIYIYNTNRIHTALKMSPRQYATLYSLTRAAAA